MADPSTRDLLRAQMQNYGVPAPIIDDSNQAAWFDPQERIRLDLLRQQQRRQWALQQAAALTTPHNRQRMVGAGKYAHYVNDPGIGDTIGTIVNYYAGKKIQDQADKEEMDRVLKGEGERQASFKRAQGELLKQRTTSPQQTGYNPPSGYAPDNSGVDTSDIGAPPKAEPVGVSLRKTIAAMDPTQEAETQGYSPAPLPQGEDLGSDPNFQRPTEQDTEQDSEYPTTSPGGSAAEHESGETLPYLEEESDSEPDEPYGTPDEPDQVDTEGEYDVARQVGGETDSEGGQQPTARQSLEKTLSMMGLRGGAADAGGYVRDPRQEAARYNQSGHSFGFDPPYVPEDIVADDTGVTGDVPQEPAPPPPAPQQAAAPTKSIPFQMPEDRSNQFLEMAYRFPSLRGALDNAYASELANQHKLQQIAAKSAQGLRGGQRYMNTGKGTIFDMQEGKEISLGAFTDRMEKEAGIKKDIQGQREAAVLELQKRKEAEAATTRAEKARLTAEANALARERLAAQAKAKSTTGGMTAYQQEQLKWKGIKNVDDLRKEYQTKAMKVQNSNQGAQTGLMLAKDPNLYTNPQLQTALVFAFGKALDPTSVVREGEYALFENARGVFESWGITPEKIAAGVRLTKAQVDSMVRVMETINSQSAERDKALYNQFGGIADRRGIDKRDIFTDPNRGKSGSGVPKKGDIVDGHRFKGGNPNDENNWEQIQ